MKKACWVRGVRYHSDVTGKTDSAIWKLKPGYVIKRETGVDRPHPFLFPLKTCRVEYTLRGFV